MAKSFTSPITVDGDTNLFTVLQSAGYGGLQKSPNETVILNNSATTLYLHLTDDGGDAPDTGTDGLPISNDTANAPSMFFTLPPFTDLQSVWLYTASSISIKVAVNGGR